MSNFSALQAMLGGGSHERHERLHTPDPERVDSFVMVFVGQDADDLLTAEEAAESSRVDFAAQRVRQRFASERLGLVGEFRTVDAGNQSLLHHDVLTMRVLVARTPRDSAWTIPDIKVIRMMAEMRIEESDDPRLAEMRDGAIERLAEMEAEADDGDESPVNAATRRQLLGEA